MTSAFGSGGLARDGGACPCGSGTSYAECCGALHRGEHEAATAQDLMRSRYAAFAVGDEAYLVRTWHPRTRPEGLAVRDRLRWVGLEILSVQLGGSGDDEGVVEYRADFSDVSGASGSLHEVSRFARRGGRWLYVDGDILPS